MKKATWFWAAKGTTHPTATFEKLAVIAAMDAVLGLGLLDLNRTDLRLRPDSPLFAVRTGASR